MHLVVTLISGEDLTQTHARSLDQDLVLALLVDGQGADQEATDDKRVPAQGRALVLALLADLVLGTEVHPMSASGSENPVQGPGRGGPALAFALEIGRAHLIVMLIVQRIVPEEAEAKTEAGKGLERTGLILLEIDSVMNQIASRDVSNVINVNNVNNEIYANVNNVNSFDHARGLVRGHDRGHVLGLLLLVDHLNILCQRMNKFLHVHTPDRGLEKE